MMTCVSHLFVGTFLSTSLFLIALASAPPNFVLYLPDETRAESIGGPFGHPLVETPNFIRLASEGTAFTSAHVMHTQCSPSRCALLTGRFMRTTGHRTQQHLVQTYEWSLLRYLHEAGYHVAWFGKNDAYARDAFEAFVDEWDGNDSTMHAVSKAVQFLQQPGGPPEPFFLYIPTIGAHPPYRSVKGGPGFPFGAAGYYSFWDGGRSTYNISALKEKAPLRGPRAPRSPAKPAYLSSIPAYRNLTSWLEGPGDEFYGIQGTYLDMVTAVDRGLGELLDALDSAPSLRDRTAVMVTSDHGDFAGDWGCVEKWPGGLDDFLTRVPLLISAPGGSRGNVVSTPVQMPDIMATVLELANITPQHLHFTISLADTVMNRAPPPSRFVFSEGGYLWPNEIEPLNSGGGDYTDRRNLYYPRGEEELEGCPFNATTWRTHLQFEQCGGGSPRAVMIRNATFKLVFRADALPVLHPKGPVSSGVGVEQNELYDLRHDPRELNNLYDTDSGYYAGVQRELLYHLLQWYLKTADVTPLFDDPRGVPPHRKT